MCNLRFPINTPVVFAKVQLDEFWKEKKKKNVIIENDFVIHLAGQFI